jgi:hypothetical protein
MAEETKKSAISPARTFLVFTIDNTEWTIEAHVINQDESTVAFSRVVKSEKDEELQVVAQFPSNNVISVIDLVFLHHGIEIKKADPVL